MITYFIFREVIVCSLINTFTLSGIDPKIPLKLSFRQVVSRNPVFCEKALDSCLRRNDKNCITRVNKTEAI